MAPDHADATCVQPSNPVPGAGGCGAAPAGTLRADDIVAPGLTGAVEAVRFAAGDTIREGGGKDGTDLGDELPTAW
ncbi:hypothetical protein [Methylobacterium frigidaeris]|uniref:Uncharacterized protein n=1 Tax=Methylobacterium frigidaeris TaxID=2038277 RepID=A0AA37HHQ3_9HYPH|nr:hypothetical protein [Methylobacterium frigidaeris]GJD66002.1 hypothetical protein MPEAHAMD_6198 [Methylobacterium frigidaeris]